MNRTLNQITSIIGLALRSTWASLGSHTAIALGVLVATTTICSIILYAEAVNLDILRDRLATAHEQATFDLLIKGASAKLDARRYQEMDSLIRSEMKERVGLPITNVGRHGWSKPVLIVPPGESPIGKHNQLPRTRFQFYANIEDQVQVVQGRFPQPTVDPQDVVEVMVTEKLAEELGLHVGDLFRVEDFDGAAQPMHVQARLAAIIRLRDPEGNFWFYAPWFLDEALTVPEQTFFQSIVLTFVPAEAEVTWAANYDETTLSVDNVASVLAGLEVLRFDLTSRLAGLQFLTNLDNVLTEYVRSTFLLKALLIVLGAPVIGIALYYILMSTGLLVEQRRGEIALLKSRGAGNAQVVGLFLAQGLLLILLTTSIAPLLAAPMAQLIGKATSFMQFENPRTLPVSVRSSLYGYAALAAGLALLAILLPTLNAAKRTIVTYRREAARDENSSTVHRYYLDLLLVLIGIWGYWTLNQSGTIITRSPTGGLDFDPLLLITPMMLVIGLTFGALRLVPWIVHGLARLVAHTNLVAPLFGLRQVARTPTRYNGLILILVFTLSLGLFTATVADAFDRNYADQALYEAGADLRTHEFDYDSASWRVRPLDEYQSLPGVLGATPARRVRLIGRQAQILAKGTLLAIDLESFGDVAWWRSDFAPPSETGIGGLEQILAPLRQAPQAVLADAGFIRRNRLKVGDTFDIDVDGDRIDFVLAGQIGYFPTLYPKEGDRLIARLDYLQDVQDAEANEVWLRTNPRQHQQTVAALRSTPGKNLVVVQDGHELTGVRKEDPVRTGLFGALSMGFIAATVLSVLGFLLYAYVTIQSRALQFGVLRATGLSTSQLIGALATEQLTLMGVGVLLGTALGGGAGWMFTRFLQLSIIAREAVPPFLVATPWLAITRLYGVLVIIFAAALIVSVYLLRRLRIYAVLRLGEQ